MIKITLKEYKDNLNKYCEIACSETIHVYNNNKRLFSLYPSSKQSLIERSEKLIGILPKDTPDNLWKERII